MDPDRPGLEVFNIHEKTKQNVGVSFPRRQDRQGAMEQAERRRGRGVAMDIDPRHKGYESWASGPGLSGVWNCKGEKVSDRKPRSCNFGVWWDGDLLREQLDRTTISKWDWLAERDVGVDDGYRVRVEQRHEGDAGPVCDIFGDWREEVIWRSADNKELRIYTTTTPTDHRLYTLMHDPQYRLSVAWQNIGYNQPTQPGFYLGDGMTLPQPRPRIRTKK